MKKEQLGKVIPRVVATGIGLDEFSSATVGIRTTDSRLVTGIGEPIRQPAGKVIGILHAFQKARLMEIDQVFKERCQPGAAFYARRRHDGWQITQRGVGNLTVALLQVGQHGFHREGDQRAVGQVVKAVALHRRISGKERCPQEWVGRGADRLGRQTHAVVNLQVKVQPVGRGACGPIEKIGKGLQRGLLFIGPQPGRDKDGKANLLRLACAGQAVG